MNHKAINYFDDQLHAKIRQHYIEGNFSGDYFLAFSKEWKDKNLPPNSTTDGLICELLDSRTNTVYTMPIYTAYDEGYYHLFDEEYRPVKDPYYTLMFYWYEEHHCQCHRHFDAVSDGLNEGTDNFECEGNRFKIVSIKPRDSDMILYSETLDLNELEGRIRGDDHNGPGREDSNRRPAAEGE